ncbi:MAG: acylneuraminate cytidylyltransferase family protein [Nanoarchaeota archaeon]
MNQKIKTMRILAVICARGGSKSIPQKNIVKLLGKPLIYYTIKTAKKFKLFDNIVVSTDDNKIASIAEKFMVDVIFRPPELASDSAGKIDVLRHALHECEQLYRKHFDIIVDLDVTAPIRTIRDIQNAMDEFLKKKPDVLFSVVRSRKNPYFNVVEEQSNGFVKLSKRSKELYLRRQDAPKVYDMNTSIYLFNREFLLNPKNISVFSTKKTAAFIMKDVSAIDVDSLLDLKYIEYLAKKGVVKL